MFCTKCGNEMQQGYSFCTKCGQKVEEASCSPKNTSSEAEIYNDYMLNVVANAFKAPSMVKFPEYNESMIQRGVLAIVYKNPMWVRPTQINTLYILTYVDATNSYGAYLREKIAIVIDDNLIPQYALTSWEGTTGWKRLV